LNEIKQNTEKGISEIRKTIQDVKGKFNKDIKFLVAHICNPSCSGGRDQEDHGSKPAQANSS
jgi:hypothetical protein